MSEKTSGVIIGLCGRSGSGKTTVCKAFEEYGIKSVDTDQVYRELTAPNEGKPSALVQRIAENFGDCVISSDGTLDRRALAAEVFGGGNGERLKMLNSITHGPILERSTEFAEQYFSEGARGVIVDAPALFESGFDKKCDRIICVSAPDDVLVRRITARDGIPVEAAKQRLSSQISDGELRERADIVIENDGRTDLAEAAKEAVGKIFD